MSKVISIKSVRAVLAIASIVAGWVFYLLVRANDPTRIFDHALLKGSGFTGMFPGMQSVPTLLHALSLAFVFSLVCSRRTSFWFFWSVSTFGFELMQFVNPILGTFDGIDILSIVVVVPVAGMLSRGLPGCSDHDFQNSVFLQNFAFGLALICSVASSDGYAPKTATHLPVCMPRVEFRESFLIDAPRPMLVAGKIYLNGNLLLVSEPFEGIHVFDNTNPVSPVAVAFIHILGNTDIAMKDNLLYADSAVDLLTIRFQGNNVSLVNRLEDVFTARTPADFSTDDVYVPQHKLDECKDSGGVVVDFIPRKDGASYQRKIEENKK